MKLASLLSAAAALALAAPAHALVQPAPPPAQAEALTIIHAGTLLAVPGRPARREASIVVRGRRIAEIRDGYVDLPGARIVDLRNAYVLPGLIDMHVHLGGARRPPSGAAPGAGPRL